MAHISVAFAATAKQESVSMVAFANRNLVQKQLDDDLVWPRSTDDGHLPDIPDTQPFEFNSNGDAGVSLEELGVQVDATTTTCQETTLTTTSTLKGEYAKLCDLWPGNQKKSKISESIEDDV